MDLINQPFLMIAGGKADTKYMTDEAFNLAVGAKNKELFVIDGYTHIKAIGSLSMCCRLSIN